MLTKLHPKLTICLILITITLAVFLPVIRHSFVVYDDESYVTNNPAVQAGISMESIRWAATAFYEATWQPMVWLSYMLDYQRSGLDPSGFHLTNLLLHIANVLLLFLALHRMTKKPWRSAFVAALFAIHPLHVESVAWIAERKDVLSTFFWMLAMYAYVPYAERPGWGRYIPVFGFMLLGLASKPAVVTLPIVLLLLDYWPLGRMKRAGDARRLILEKIPLFALSIGSSIITSVAQTREGALASSDALPFMVRMSNAVVSYAAYLIKMVWPAKLAVLYPHPMNTLPVWQVAASSVALVCLTVLFLRMGRKRPYLAVGWLWYLIVLVPMIGIIQTGQHAMADRFTYVSLIGAFIMIAWGAPSLLSRPLAPQALWRRSPASLDAPSPSRPLSMGLAAMAVLVVLALMLPARRQVSYWKDSISLFSHTVAVTKDNYTAHMHLGLAYNDAGLFDEAIREYRTVIEIQPDEANAHLNLALPLANSGDFTGAWNEVHECRRLGLEPNSEFVEYLRQQMPEPP